MSGFPKPVSAAQIIAAGAEIIAHKDQASGYAGLSAGSTLALAQIPAGVELTANKDAANGYAGLGSDALVPAARLGSGATAAKFLRGDKTWQTITSGVSNIWLPPQMLSELDPAPNLAPETSVSWAAWLLDAATQEGVGTDIIVPTGWATLAVDIYWANGGAGAGNVRWFSNLVDKAVGATLALGSNSFLTAAAGLVNVVLLSTLATAQACTPGDLYNVGIFRDGADAADTLTNDVALLGVNIRQTS